MIEIIDSAMVQERTHWFLWDWLTLLTCAVKNEVLKPLIILDVDPFEMLNKLKVYLQELKGCYRALQMNRTHIERQLNFKIIQIQAHNFKMRPVIFRYVISYNQYVCINNDLWQEILMFWKQYKRVTTL